MIRDTHKLLFNVWKWLQRGCNLGIRILKIIRNVCILRMSRYMQEYKEEKKNNIVKATISHNMDTNIDEMYYKKQYWHWIEKTLKKLPKKHSVFKILDLGCGQGRITFLLAKWIAENGGGHVIGVDISGPALDYARKAALNHHLVDNGQCQFIEMDILEFLNHVDSASYQCVVCTEVFFILPQYLDVCHEVNRVLVKGGLFICAVRSKYFNILKSVDQKLWDALPVLLNNTEGFPWYPTGWLSWHTTSSFSNILIQNDFRVLSCRGIGVCSGIEGDPLSKIVQPSLLLPEEQDELMQLEIKLAEEMADCGRYILIEAEKI